MPTPFRSPSTTPGGTAPDGPALRSPSAVRLRLGASIAVSTLFVALAAAVLAVQCFLPGLDPDEPTGAGALMRLYERSGAGWLAGPLLALLLPAGLPRRRDLHALPTVLGVVAMVLILLCALLPRLTDGLTALRLLG